MVLLSAGPCREQSSAATRAVCLLRRRHLQAVMAGGGHGDPMVRTDPPKIRVVVRTRPMSAKVSYFLRYASTACYLLATIPKLHYSSMGTA